MIDTAADRALVVVDVQRDFCEGGALGVAGGHAVAARISALLEGDHRAGDHGAGDHGAGDHVVGDHGYGTVVATRDHHIDPGSHFSDTPDFVDSWPPHCVVGTPGAELDDVLTDTRFDAIFDKGDFAAAYSGFEGRDAKGAPLADWLRARGVTEVDVCGIATDYCVRATALDAAEAGFTTRVLLDLTAAVDPSRVEAVLAELAGAGVEIATS